MRNKLFLSSALIASMMTGAYAGGMGPVETYTFKPFVLGEAAYSWPQIAGMNVDVTYATVTTNPQVQGWGGRIATGLSRQISEKFALSMEGGLVYHDHIAMDPIVNYQSAKISTRNPVLNANFDQYGFDLLAGIHYARPKYDLFFKAGALLENLRSQMVIDGNSLLKNSVHQNNFRANANQTINTNIGQIMPEIKLGGAYHFNEDWSLTAAWMHAFGGTLEFGGQLNTSGTTLEVGGMNFSVNNPTINSVMFGIQYDFS